MTQTLDAPTSVIEQPVRVETLSELRAIFNEKSYSECLTDPYDMSSFVGALDHLQDYLLRTYHLKPFLTTNASDPELLKEELSCVIEGMITKHHSYKNRLMFNAYDPRFTINYERDIENDRRRLAADLDFFTKLYINALASNKDLFEMQLLTGLLLMPVTVNRGRGHFDTLTAVIDWIDEDQAVSVISSAIEMACYKTSYWSFDPRVVFIDLERGSTRRGSYSQLISQLVRGIIDRVHIAAVRTPSSVNKQMESRKSIRTILETSDRRKVSLIDGKTKDIEVFIPAGQSLLNAMKTLDFCKQRIELTGYEWESFIGACFTLFESMGLSEASNSIWRNSNILKFAKRSGYFSPHELNTFLELLTSHRGLFGRLQRYLPTF